MKATRQRFARSINVERDGGTDAINGYIPVGRAIDVISRFASALDNSDVEVAISVTGPYGSGKSSLALLLDALLGPKTSPARHSAEELLEGADPLALSRIANARKRFNADRYGFIRATVTAQRESITATVLRALLNGVNSFTPPAKDKTKLAEVVARIERMKADLEGKGRVWPSSRDIRDVIVDLGKIAPVLLLIDEFGKNLEAFADSRSDADLFLLQELAEWTRGGDGIPLALVTLQHMAFDEYADNATAVQRREWAKIQGRFEDIPFVDSPKQTRVLIAAAFDKPSATLIPALKKWSAEQAEELINIGLLDLGASKESLADCWPLHPLALAALPELCERYGQNERTLFSFLAGHEPRSVASFLRETSWKKGEPLPVVQLDALYDYFLESASNLVAVSANASRWLEIDTRVRDALGLSDAQRRVLKTVGLLNLVSAGGTLRASKRIIAFAARDGRDGTATADEVIQRLAELEQLGLITFRDFADEYRIWQGSDFDLRSSVDLARRRLRATPTSELLNRVLPLRPIVAAKHSHRTGTLRAFARSWVSADVDEIEPLSFKDRFDGLVLYVVGHEAPVKAVSRRVGMRPVVFVVTDDSENLISAAVEVGALDEILSSSEELSSDWVARRELQERRVEAYSTLENQFFQNFSEGSATWIWPSAQGNAWESLKTNNPSGVISQVCDSWYQKSPEIHNDMANRHELSSQATRALRLLVEHMISNPGDENLGIEGFGPEKTLYLSVLKNLGIHAFAEGAWGFVEPPRRRNIVGVRPVWEYINNRLGEASTGRLRVSDLYDELSAPPYGIRTGIAPIITLAALIEASDEVALYEHGTFRPVLSDAVLERLLKNPANFEVKHFSSRTGARAKFLMKLSKGLGGAEQQVRAKSVLAVVSQLVLMTNTLPEYTKKTHNLSDDALALRKALLIATEPDDLLFAEIPSVFGCDPIPPRGTYSEQQLARMANKVAMACNELRTAYPRLIEEVGNSLREHVGPGLDPLREGLTARAMELKGHVIDPALERLVMAMTAEIPDLDSWLTYVAMSVSGTPPEAWTDSDRKRCFVSFAELGATFRRIYALTAELDARSEGFDAYRHVITRPDGREVVQIVAIDEQTRQVGKPLLGGLIEETSKTLGVSSLEARKVLLALLGEQDFEDSATIDHVDVAAPVYPEGKLRRQKGIQE
jgi:hypothetical protein